MGLTPKIQRSKAPFLLKSCSKCGQSFGPEAFAPTTSVFYSDGVIPICNDCVNSILEENDYDWEIVDKVCQMVDVPFIPKEWEKIRQLNSSNTFYKYAEIFKDSKYYGLGWKTYCEEFKRLQEQGIIKDELPLLDDDRRNKLKELWGGNYDDEALNYLENLYNGLLMSQNVNGSLQIDQARKICKISYEIDCRLREGGDIDKLLAAYDKIVKAADFTPKNAKNVNDFDSVGELFRWLEKRGWKNQYYDGVSKDIVDETIKNIQAWNQRLYTEESGIGDEITRRIEALKTAKQLEDNYYIESTSTKDELDKYENEGFDKLYADETFEVEVDDGRE